MDIGEGSVSMVSYVDPLDRSVGSLAKMEAPIEQIVTGTPRHTGYQTGWLECSGVVRQGGIRVQGVPAD